MHDLEQLNRGHVAVKALLSRLLSRLKTAQPSDFHDLGADPPKTDRERPVRPRRDHDRAEHLLRVRTAARARRRQNATRKRRCCCAPVRPPTRISKRSSRIICRELLADGFRVIDRRSAQGERCAPIGAARKCPRPPGQLRICGQLSDRDVAAEYQKHEIVWVHSLREGFGRCVVEGRLAGSRVICTNIPEFAELRADARSSRLISTKTRPSS